MSCPNCGNVSGGKMNAFDRQLESIDTGKIRAFLLSRQTPCYESELMKVAFPEMRIAESDPLALYKSHFILFHILYCLKDDFYEEHKYLHIHFMRTTLADYPPEGQCRFFEEHTGQFCGTPNRVGNHCEFHSKKIRENELDEISDKYFYFDRDNFFALDAETAKTFIEGTWEILSHYDEYQKSFRILDLPDSANITDVKKKFRILAKKYHPDLGEKSHEKFNEINRAYRLLKRLMPNPAFSKKRRT